MKASSIRLGVDIGGTFTDVVLEGDDASFSTKVLTTYAAPEDAIIDGIASGLRQGWRSARQKSARSSTARRWPPMR